MNESNTGALGIPELKLPVAMDFHINLHAPTGECATMNESNPSAVGIPESMPPVGGGLL